VRGGEYAKFNRSWKKRRREEFGTRRLALWNAREIVIYKRWM